MMPLASGSPSLSDRKTQDRSEHGVMDSLVALGWIGGVGWGGTPKKLSKNELNTFSEGRDILS